MRRRRIRGKLLRGTTSHEDLIAGIQGQKKGKPGNGLGLGKNDLTDEGQFVGRTGPIGLVGAFDASFSDPVIQVKKVCSWLFPLLRD